MIAGLCAAAVLFATARDRPALVVSASAESRAALLAAVRSALGGAQVTLADDALSRESVLTIERTARRDAAGRRIQGREMGAPERFRLVKSGPACVLIQERTGRRFPLEHTECVETRGPVH
jgi:hypothetical protein